jgi:predicted ArsR family transcriptional regulator
MSERPEDQLDHASFTATVTSLTLTFGDATRRAIYLCIRERDGATVGELADECGVHANVVRHHLGILSEAGVIKEAASRTGGVGRPSKVFVVTDETLDITSLGRRDALMVALLERALEELGPERAETLATEVGLDYGKKMAMGIGAGEPGRAVTDVIHSVAGTLTAHGFDARVGSDPTVLEKANCPFGQAAEHHPVLCAVDRGLVAGMFEGLGVAVSQPINLSSRLVGDDACRTQYTS